MYFITVFNILKSIIIKIPLKINIKSIYHIISIYRYRDIDYYN